MKQIQNFYTCSNSEHEAKEILGLCLNVECQYLRPYCHMCMKDFHIDHVNDLQEIQLIPQWHQNKKEIFSHLKETKSILSRIQDFINNWSDRLQIQEHDDLFSIGINTLDKIIGKQIILSELEPTILEIEKKLGLIFNQIKETAKSVDPLITFLEEKNFSTTEKKDPVKSHSDQKQRIRGSYYGQPQNQQPQRTYNSVKSPTASRTKSLLSQNQKTPKKQETGLSQMKITNSIEKRLDEQQSKDINKKGVVIKIEQNIQKEEKVQTQVLEQNTDQTNQTKPTQVQENIIEQEEIIPRDSKFRFSQDLKYEALKVLKNGTLITNSGGFGLCLPAIQINQDALFGFRIIKNDVIYVGVCDNYFAKVSNYNFSLNDSGHGCYLIASNSLVYSTMEPELNNSKKGFEFRTFDTIIVEVSMSMSKITWTNSQQKKKFTMKIDSKKCLYPCVKLQKYRFSCEPEVEILNF